MKNFTLILLMVAFVFACPWTEAQLTGKEIVQAKEKHISLLSTFRSPLAQGTFQMQTMGERNFSVFSSNQEVSLCTREAGKQYLWLAKKEDNNNGFTMSFTVHIYLPEQNEPSVSINATLKKSPQSFELNLSPEAVAMGYTVDSFLPLVSGVSQCVCSKAEWWQGFLTFDPVALERETYYATRNEAVQHVPTHVDPKYCFVWKDGSSATPWRPIPGTGCAHWVAHQKGITSSPGCYDGRSIRVSQVVSGKVRYSISNASVGDVWTNTDLSHCGIVIGVGSGSVTVRHCSSGSGGVVVSTFTSGYAYR